MPVYLGGMPDPAQGHGNWQRGDKMQERDLVYGFCRKWLPSASAQKGHNGYGFFRLEDESIFAGDIFAAGADMEDGGACSEGEQVCFALVQSCGRPVARRVVRLGSFKPRSSFPYYTNTEVRSDSSSLRTIAPESSPEPSPSVPIPSFSPRGSVPTPRGCATSPGWPSWTQDEEESRVFEQARLQRERVLDVEWAQYRAMWETPGQVILWVSLDNQEYKFFTDNYRTGEGEPLSVGRALQQFLARLAFPLFDCEAPEHSSFLADHYALFAIPPRSSAASRLNFHLPVTDLRPFLGAYFALFALNDSVWNFRTTPWVREINWQTHVSLQLFLDDDPQNVCSPGSCGHGLGGGVGPAWDLA